MKNPCIELIDCDADIEAVSRFGTSFRWVLSEHLADSVRTNLRDHGVASATLIAQSMIAKNPSLEGLGPEGKAAREAAKIAFIDEVCEGWVTCDQLDGFAKGWGRFFRNLEHQRKETT